jgi:hypothetical protein
MRPCAPSPVACHAARLRAHHLGEISASGEAMHTAFVLLWDALKRIISQVSARDMV